MLGYGLNDSMFNNQQVNFFKFEGNKNGSPKEYNFRILPCYAPDKLFFKTAIHWGFKNIDGKTKTIVCLNEKADGKDCPICDYVKYMQGQLENIEAALKFEADPNKRQELEKYKTDYETLIGETKRKPMFIWNVLDGEGKPRVLQLSYNAHEPLWDKVKWLWDNLKIDVTSFNRNLMMYCNRSGLKAKTRYQYELIQNTEKDLTGSVNSLIDLSKVYVKKNRTYLEQVVKLGFIADEDNDPTDRSYTTETEKHQIPINSQSQNNFVPPAQPPQNNFVPPAQPPQNNFVPPAQQPQNNFVPPAQPPQNNFVPPAQPPQNNFVPPAQPPQNNFVPPAQPPQNNFVPPAQPPQNNFVPPAQPPQNNFVPPAQPPQNNFVPPAQPPQNNFVPPAQPPQNNFVPPAQPPQNNFVPPAQPPQNNFVPPVQPPQNNFVPPAQPQFQEQVQLTSEQDKKIAEMMQALNN